MQFASLLAVAHVVIGQAIVNGQASGSTLFVAPPLAEAFENGTREHPLRDLRRATEIARFRSYAVGGADSAVTLVLAPGDYTLAPAAIVEPTCGNCENPNTAVAVTVGLLVSGHGVRIEGAAGHGSVLRTRAGYGVFFRDCTDCSLEGVVVTEGFRDTSGNATDAAIVVQRSSVALERNWIVDNIGDSITVSRTIVGVAGIAVREGGRARIVGNRVERNSWDGIALYRDAEAQIVDNVIDGVDLAVGKRIGGGRGVGIGCTWNAKAEIRGNLIRRYWKGIGLFLDADGVVQENVVTEIATWGLTLWDAGRGHPRGSFRWNVVDSTGACGASIVRQADEPGSGELVENIFTRTGQNPKYDTGEPYCFQTAIALHAKPTEFPVRGNLLFANRESGNDPGSGDVDEATFRRQAQPICVRLAAYAAASESPFYRRYHGIPPADPTAVPRSPRGWGRSARRAGR